MTELTDGRRWFTHLPCPAHLVNHCFVEQLQNSYDAVGFDIRTVLLFYRWCRSLLVAVPTPAGTRAGSDKRWVTMPATGRSHGRATEPIAEGWQFRSQVIHLHSRGLVTHTADQ